MNTYLNNVLTDIKSRNLVGQDAFGELESHPELRDMADAVAEIEEDDVAELMSAMLLLAYQSGYENGWNGFKKIGSAA